MGIGRHTLLTDLQEIEERETLIKISLIFYDRQKILSRHGVPTKLLTIPFSDQFDAIFKYCQHLFENLTAFFYA